MSELAKALVAVMDKARYVRETAKNKHFGYNYASDEDILAALRPAMIANGLAMFPTDCERQTVPHSPTAKGAAQWRTDIIMTYRLLHVSGETMTVKVPGCGIDPEDKGAYKALTGAMKYALRNTFLIPTGNDPERFEEAEVVVEDEVVEDEVETDADDEVEADETPAGAAAFEALARQSGLDPDTVRWYHAAILGKDPTKGDAPSDYPLPKLVKTIEWYVSAAERVDAEIGKLRDSFRAAFFAKWGALHPTPSKADLPDDGERTAMLTSIETSRRLLCSSWYGTASLKDIGTRAMLKSERNLRWLRGVQIDEFEAAVVAELESIRAEASALLEEGEPGDARDGDS